MKDLFYFAKNIIHDFKGKDNIRAEYANFKALLSNKIENKVLQDYYMDILQTADEVRYATGGYTVIRGYLSRKIREPITVGGCNRGKLLKKKTSRSKISYEYYFIDNQLVMVKGFVEGDETQCWEVEFVNRINGIEVGIVYEAENFNDSVKIKNIVKEITLCKFNGQQLMGVCSYSVDIELYTKEILQYEQNKLVSVDFVEFGRFFRGKPEVIDADKINFLYNSNDYPNEYFFSSKSEDLYEVSKVNQLFFAEHFNI